MKVKICTDCGKDNTVEPFVKHRRLCKPCSNIRAKSFPSAQRAHRRLYLQKWRAKNPLKQRGYEITASYKPTPEQRDTLLNWNGGPCSACGKPLVEFGTGIDNAQLDHCHRTMMLRGIVCGGCNKALGMVDDSIEHLEKLILYLQGKLQFSYWA